MPLTTFGLLAVGAAAFALHGLGHEAHAEESTRKIDTGLQAKFLKDLTEAGLPAQVGPSTLVKEAEIAGLPEPAQRYMRFMQVIGEPRIWSFRVQSQGLFRPGLKRDWVPCTAWQYNSRSGPTRYFMIRMDWVGPLAVIARDTYINGQGRMHGKLLDLFTVVDATGPEFDLGELVTYLNDAVLYAPSMLLAPEVQFAPVDENSFDVTLTDRGTSATARVFVNERGAVTDFSTTDRFFSDPSAPNRPPMRTRWSTPVTEWTTFRGRPIPSQGEGVWHLPEGPFTYAKLGIVVESLVYNVLPGASAHATNGLVRRPVENVGAGR